MGQVISLDTTPCLGLGQSPLGRPRFAEREQAATYRNILNAIGEGVLIYTREGRLLEANDAAMGILGYSRQKLLCHSVRHLVAPRRNKLATLFKSLRRVMAGQAQQFEFWAKHAAGACMPLQLTLSLCDYHGTSTVLAIFQDMRGHHAGFDPLTRLPNRSMLGNWLRQALPLAREKQERLAIAYLDLDGFKPVNDRLGRDTGDRVLVELAGRLEHLVGEAGTIARIGGDEFVCVLQLRHGFPLENRLNQLLEAVAAPYACLAEPFPISGSLGVTFFPDDDSCADVLLRHADQAMYTAKRDGNNGVAYFNVEAAKQDSAWQQIRAQVRVGLRQDEFRLFYQPKVNMRSGAVVGLEALVRWQHPERGLLEPGQFLPAVEDSELIEELGFWCLRKALAQLEVWWLEGFNLNVSVNIAPRQLHQPDFPKQLECLLRDYPNLARGQLELEILETTAFENTGKASQVIEACSRLGVHFSIDDFGTGYSSLAYLKTLPATTLKIDQCFVREILDEPGEVAIVEGILGLARAFRHQVIAEGVESVAHGSLLMQLGCDLAQGYGIARPMPADQVTGWIQSWVQPSPWKTLAEWYWAQEDHSLLAMAVEHRHWTGKTLQALESGQVVKDENLFDPSLNCLGAWYEGRGQALYGTHAFFSNMEPPLHKVHVLVQRVADLLLEGRQQEARALKTPLLEGRDQVLAALSGLQLQVARTIQVGGP